MDATLPALAPPFTANDNPVVRLLEAVAAFFDRLAPFDLPPAQYAFRLLTLWVLPWTAVIGAALAVAKLAAA